MSLALNQGTRPDGVVASCPTAEVVLIGELELSMVDFCELVLYALTNTDLVAGDARLHLMNQIAKLSPIQGHNPGGYRMGVWRSIEEMKREQDG